MRISESQNNAEIKPFRTNTTVTAEKIRKACAEEFLSYTDPPIHRVGKYFDEKIIQISVNKNLKQIKLAFPIQVSERTISEVIRFLNQITPKYKVKHKKKNLFCDEFLTTRGHSHHRRTPKNEDIGSRFGFADNLVRTFTENVQSVC